MSKVSNRVLVDVFFFLVKRDIVSAMLDRSSTDRSHSGGVAQIALCCVSGSCHGMIAQTHPSVSQLFKL